MLGKLFGSAILASATFAVKLAALPGTKDDVIAGFNSIVALGDTPDYFTLDTYKKWWSDGGRESIDIDFVTSEFNCMDAKSPDGKVTLDDALALSCQLDPALCG